MTTFRPLGDRVLIDPVGGTGREEADSGLVVIRGYDPQVMGTVVAVGPGTRCPTCQTRIAPAVAVGDRVLFAASSGERITEGGRTQLILSATQILAILD